MEVSTAFFDATGAGAVAATRGEAEGSDDLGLAFFLLATGSRDAVLVGRVLLAVLVDLVRLAVFVDLVLFAVFVDPVLLGDFVVVVLVVVRGEVARGRASLTPRVAGARIPTCVATNARDSAAG